MRNSPSQRRCYRTLILLQLFLLTMLTAPVFPGETTTVKFAAFDYPPFYFQQAGQVKGIAVDLVHKLCNRMEITAEIRMYPLARALKYLEDGEEDAVMMLIRTPAREKFLFFTEPVLEVRGLIWSSAGREEGAVEFKTLHDLKPYRLGVTLGYSYGKEFDRMILCMRQVSSSPSDLSNYRKLLADRIDIFPGNEIVARHLFKSHPELRGQFVHAQNSFITWKLYMAVSKDSALASQMVRINGILSELKKNDFIHKTVKRYTE